MSVTRFFGKVLNSLLTRFGYELHRADNLNIMRNNLIHKGNEIDRLSHELEAVSVEIETFSMQGALSRIVSRTIDIETVIDVGASDGMWSREAMKYFPHAFYFLIEANKVHESRLKAFTQDFKNTDYILAGAGDEKGEVFFYFNEDDPYGGHALHAPERNTNLIKVPSTTIDIQVKEKGLKPPFLIKLDTHGFEIPILNGAKETLTQTNLLVIETYNFNLSKDSLLFYQMCAHLDSKDFRCIDLCCPLYRPKDKAFWQCDLFFIPSYREEFKSNTYC